MGVVEVKLGDLVAMMAIAGMSSSDREAYIEYDQRTRMVKMEGEVDMLDKYKQFVELKTEARTQIGRLEKKIEPTSTKKDDAVKHPEVYSVQEEKDKNKPCPFFKNRGFCSRSRCPFIHTRSDVKNDNSHNSTEREKHCYHFKREGTCVYGDTCIFKHVQGDGGMKRDDHGVDKNKKHVAFGLTKMNVDYGSSDEDESGSVVKIAVETSKVCNVKESGRSGETLGWDSMAAISIANKESLLEDVTPVSDRQVVGVGGHVNIKSKGTARIFGDQKMCFLEGGLPGVDTNILSIAKAVRLNEKNEPGICLMMPEGAVRLRCNKEMWQRAIDLVNYGAKLGRVEGEAVVEDNVYIQKFPHHTKEKRVASDSSYKVCRIQSIYGNRVPLGGAEEVVGLLSSAGVSKQALLDGIAKGSILGLPCEVTKETVEGFFDKVGKDEEQLMADITKASLQTPLDYEKEKAKVPGEVVVMDNLDPSFNRVVKTSGGKKEPVVSIQGAKDAVLAVDEASGYLQLWGRKTKKNPHLIVKDVIKQWRRRWKCLRLVKMDAEFVTEASMQVRDEEGVVFKQAVPGQHARVVGMVEGCVRWVQDNAQANMLRIKKLIDQKVINKKDGPRLWFYALRLAVITSNMREYLLKNGKTRHEECSQVKPNLSEVVLLPFGMRIVGRKLKPDENGRGQAAIYLGPSELVPGGILTFNLETKRVAVKYSFIPREHMPAMTDLNLGRSIDYLYGNLCEVVPNDVIVVNNSAKQRQDEVVTRGMMNDDVDGNDMINEHHQQEEEEEPPLLMCESDDSDDEDEVDNIAEMNFSSPECNVENRIPESPVVRERTQVHFGI